MNTEKGEPRTYRAVMARPGLVSFHVSHMETDLHIQAARDLSRQVSDWILGARLSIEGYGSKRPEFLRSFTPISPDFFAPPIVQTMIEAGASAGTGPMAAVAGAIAECVGMRCLETAGGEVIVENGGDIFMAVTGPVKVGIWAGASPFSGKVCIGMAPGAPIGICTSSGTVGHSISFGKADAVTIVSRSCPHADAIATAVGNLIKSERDVDRVLASIGTFPDIIGAVLIKGERLGAWGAIELLPLE